MIGKEVKKLNAIDETNAKMKKFAKKIFCVL
jgi:hypothetical protein